jgi:SulP family sulfate permease
MIGVMDRYAQGILDNGGIVKLAGVNEAVLAQLERTGLVTLLGRENIYVAQRQWGAAAMKAYEDAQVWLEEKKKGAG